MKAIKASVNYKFVAQVHGYWGTETHKMILKARNLQKTKAAQRR